MKTNTLIAIYIPYDFNETKEYPLAGNALNIPVHFFVGDRDRLMATTDTWNDKFKSRGVDVEYIIYPGIDHNSWEYAYKDGFIFEWFSQFERNLFPNEVNFTTTSFKYDRGLSGRVMTFPRAIADNSIRQGDLETSNLVLFGTAETNSWIAKYDDRLPMLLDAFPDFILFKDTPDNVISEGYFTNNREIPESERSRLEGSGVVEIK